MAQTGEVRSLRGPGMTPPIELVGASSTRLTLSLSIDTGIGYVTDVDVAVAGTGWSITPASPLHLTYAQHGDIVRHRWRGSSQFNTSLFGVIETHASPGV